LIWAVTKTGRNRIKNKNDRIKMILRVIKYY